MSELEDELSDIVSKAQRGLAISTSQLADLAGLDVAEVRSTRSEEPNKDATYSIAPHLGLRADGLWKVYDGSYKPAAPNIQGCIRIDTPAPMPSYEEMRVNAFLLQHPGSDEAVLFDTGTRLDAVIEALGNQKLVAVCVTHTHWDHIEILKELMAHFPEISIYGPPLDGAPSQTILEGTERLHLAGLEISVSQTRGHAHDGLSYIVSGLETPIAIVGDAIFAGSVGGMAAEDYSNGLQAIRDHILSLDPKTLIAPGHAGLTTVGYEKEHNPFF